MDIASLTSSLAEAKATIESQRKENEAQLEGYRSPNARPCMTSRRCSQYQPDQSLTPCRCAVVATRQRNDEQMRVAMSAEAEASEARERRNELEQQVVQVRRQRDRCARAGLAAMGRTPHGPRDDISVRVLDSSRSSWPRSR
jgi:hypothetical protein